MTHVEAGVFNMIYHRTHCDMPWVEQLRLELATCGGQYGADASLPMKPHHSSLLHIVEPGRLGVPQYRQVINMAEGIQFAPIDSELHAGGIGSHSDPRQDFSARTPPP